MVNHLIWHISSMFMGVFTTKNRVEDLKEVGFSFFFTNVGIQTKQTVYILTSNALKVRRICPDRNLHCLHCLVVSRV
jgi:hypothetical protein